MIQAFIELLFGLLEMFLELFWGFFLPVICYFTAVLLVPAATFGKIAVEYPKNSAKLHWSWRNWIGISPQGKTILSPALGAIIGLTFWIFAAALAILSYRHFPAST
jgi:hypothetical protein